MRAMTEIFNELSVVGESISEEDRVVQIFASLPESYNMLVTALEANSEVPKMEVVMERLLHEERKLKERTTATNSEEVMTVSNRHRRKGPKCYFCKKLGHIALNVRRREFLDNGRRKAPNTESIKLK